ncbi:restriction endonuclease subunit S [Achromobacter pestifer]|uniref:Type I restriction modification DNA specificity domain-containing protein n=1 Tax=Achromobacter pestifer TaxID=1353889 RepID=A0A6S6ZU77_9BURK|nr:restriction endonuclease subunit S [Achromobacter pestifer]CAB3697098.1 hypothetical protein LMG3431_05198 [Achromobacter pestifer]
MSSEWSMVKLGELADFQEGYVNPSQREPDYFDGDIKWLRATDLNDGLVTNTSRTLTEKGFRSAGKSASLFEPGTLAISKSGTIGRVGLLGDRMCGNRAVINIKPKSHAIPRYIFFVLRHLRPVIETLAEGSVQKNLYVSALSNLSIPAPARHIQQAIASCLGALDDRIMLLRETNKTLELIAQAIFKSWFVDFDPVHAKMEGRQPEGMDEETAALFPDSFEESGLGLIPTQWSARSFHEMIRIIGGGTPKTSNPGYWGGHIPWYSVVDVPNGADTFVVNTEKKITQAGLEGSSTKLLPFGTTIISARGTVGKLALTGCEMAMNQSCYGLRGQNNDIFFTYFSTQRLVEHLKQQAHGSVFDTITTATFKGVRVASPPPSIIARFETNVEVLMERVLVNLQTLTSLAQLRDTLLPRLISGQIRLPEAQEQVESALS